jgi:hypothetical protein
MSAWFKKDLAFWGRNGAAEQSHCVIHLKYEIRVKMCVPVPRPPTRSLLQARAPHTRSLSQARAPHRTHSSDCTHTRLLLQRIADLNIFVREGLGFNRETDSVCHA